MVAENCHFVLKNKNKKLKKNNKKYKIFLHFSLILKYFKNYLRISVLKTKNK